MNKSTHIHTVFPYVLIWSEDCNPGLWYFNSNTGFSVQCPMESIIRAGVFNRLSFLGWSREQINSQPWRYRVHYVSVWYFFKSFWIRQSLRFKNLRTNYHETIVKEMEPSARPELEALLSVSSTNVMPAPDRHDRVLFTQHHMFTPMKLKSMHFSTLAGSPWRSHMPHS